MYVLEDGTSLTNAIKEAFKRGLTRAYIKVGTTIIDQSNYLVSAKYRDEKADPESGMFIGVTSMRELTIKLLNIDNDLNLENADIEYHIGALVGEEYKYINLGNFIVQKPTNEEVNEEMTFTALDYMSKFDTDDEYVPQVVFPTTLLGLAQDVCSQAGITLGNTNFRNASKQILANPFVNGENMRTVLKSIAKLSFSCCYIGQDNKLYFGFTQSDFSSVTEEITTDGYFENKPNDETKKITALTLRSSEIKSVGQTIYDEDHIVEYGTNELIIEEDYLAYTDELRLAYLNGATDLFGLTYKPLSVDTLGSIYLSFNDTIKVVSPQGDSYYTYALNNTHEYNGTLYNTITVPALSEVEEQYKYETEDENSKRRTAVDINKAEQRIQLIETEIGDRSEKESSITQEIDQIEIKISDLENLLVDVEGINPLTLENCLEGELIKLNIKGNNTVFSGLTPSNTLVPSNELVPYGDSKLYIYTKNKCNTKQDDWELTTSPLTITTNKFVEIDTDYVGYFSFKGNVDDVVLYNIYFYDKKKQFLGSFAYSFNRDVFKGARETEVIFPPGTKYVTFYLRRVDNEGNFINFDSFDMNEIRPMLEYVSKYKDSTTYSGVFSRYWMQLDSFKNYGYFYVSNTGISVTDNTEIEIRYKEFESTNSDIALFSTENDLFNFYTKTSGDYNEKLLKYNGTNHVINTTYDYVGVETTVSFRKDSNTGDYILTLSDSEGHEESFDISATTTFSDAFAIMGEFNATSKIDVALYEINIWENGTLAYDFMPTMNKDTGKIGLATHTIGSKAYTWSSAYNQPGTDGITLFEAPDTEYQEYNYQVIDLGIIEPLRQFSPTVYDEFTYDAEYLYNFSEEDDEQEYKAIVTRRVGVTAGGEMYELATPIIEVLSFPDIMLVNGTNYIDLSKPYAANMKATYVQITDFTKIFATQYQVTSQIIQLANSITLLVSEKVGKDEVIAQINVAVEDHQGVIRLIGNQVIIQSDYFELTADGTIKATQGEIANFDMWRGQSTYTTDSGTSATTQASFLTKYYVSNNQGYVAGMMIPDVVHAKQFDFIFAGAKASGEHSFALGTDTLLRIFNDGRMVLKTTSGSSKYKGDLQGAYISVTDTTDQVATTIGSSLIESYYVISGEGGSLGTCMHNANLTGNVVRYWWDGSKLAFAIDQSGSGELSANCWINSGSSDERLKKEISTADDKLVNIVGETEIKQFKFIDDKNGKLRFGIIAQELIQKAEEKDYDLDDTDIIQKTKRANDIENDKEYYAVDYDSIQMLKIKFLENEVKKQKQIIDSLINRIEKLEKGE